jgi:hypothetical protein
VLYGPSEAALEGWKSELRLAPASTPGRYRPTDSLPLLVIETKAGGAGAAFNAGMAAAQSPLIALVDPECDFTPDLLLRLVRPVLDDPEGTPAVLGVAPAPPARGMAARFGALESVRAWLARGAALAGWNRLLPLPGCALLFRRDEATSGEGLRNGATGLLLEIHARTRRAGRACAVALVPEPVSRGRAPDSLAELRSRTLRDQRMLARAMAGRGRTARLWAAGWAIPALFSMRFLRPLAETAAYGLAAVGLLAGYITPALAGTVLLSTVGMGIVLSMAAVALQDLAEPGASDPDRLAALFLAAAVESFGYRQLRNLWMIKGFLAGLR